MQIYKFTHEYILEALQKVNIVDIKAEIVFALIVAICVIIVIPSVGFVLWLLNYFIYRVTNRLFGPKVAVFVCNMLTFPGVILHEIAHVVAIFLSGGEINEIKLFEYNKENNTLGSVSYSAQGNLLARSVQLSLGNCAPVLFGIIEIWAMYKYLLPNTHIVIQIFVWYFIVSIGFHASMSKSDLKGYIRGVWIMGILVAAVSLFIQLYFM